MTNVPNNPTIPGRNQVTLRINFSMDSSGVIEIFSNKDRKKADHYFYITVEYPTYEEELQMKQSFQQYNREVGAIILNLDLFRESRVRRCLAAWTIPKDAPMLEKEPLNRFYSLLDDKSLSQWKSLPPVLRKEISTQIDTVIGPV